MINVLIIEDHVLVSQAIRYMLADINGICVVGEATTGQAGLALAREKQPDMVLLDLRLPDSHGLEIARKLIQRVPTAKILVLTAMHNELLLRRLLELGIDGYMTKDSDQAELARAIRAVHSGQRYMSPAIANRLVVSQFANDHKQSSFDDLSKREMETLLLLAKGMSIDRIAKQLFISTKTVNSYRYRMFEKLGVANDVSLITLAIRHGLIDVDRV